ncbi:MAG: hypothetical protein PF693_12280, partial [Spirochaetia bacterium]|nr:hypothetical protein [Spirochaetia bacterium]
SIILLIIIFISYQFLKDIHRISEEKKYSENLLDNTYKYLGITNRKIDILKDFITIMADKNVDSRSIIESLIKISNKIILNGEETGLIDDNFQYLKSTLAYTKIECAFIFDSNCKDFDDSFLIILLAQIHSLAIIQKLIPYTELKKTNVKW